MPYLLLNVCEEAINVRVLCYNYACTTNVLELAQSNAQPRKLTDDLRFPLKPLGNVIWYTEATQPALKLKGRFGQGLEMSFAIFIKDVFQFNVFLIATVKLACDSISCAVDFRL